MTTTDDRLRRMRPFGDGAAGARAGSAAPIPSSALPPGPRWPSLLQSVALLRFRHRFVPAMHHRYGDVFTVRIMPGGSALVLYTRPEHAREIFAGDPEVFHAGKGNAILGPIMGEHSLLLQDGGEHKRARRLLMPAFNGAALRGYQQLVAEIARTEVASWTPGETFRSLDRMNALTLEVILRVVFGVTDEERLAELRPRVNRTVDVSPVVLFGWGYPWLQKVGPWRRTVQNQRELDALMYAEIRERRAAPDLAERSDVLTRLLRVGADGADGTGSGTGDAGVGSGERPLDDTELRDQLVTLLLAGHETTATALSWALYELGRDAALRARAQQAADGDQPADDDYLEAVLKESMRLHPVIPMVVRHLMAPATIGGWDLPRGVNVGPSILLGHARAESFPAPERFDPTRFLDGPVTPNTWIPFGGGVRRCIGAGFSLMEGIAVLREVLREYDVRAAGEDEPKVRNITSVPRRGARVTVTPR
jgi:cytochrome P450